MYNLDADPPIIDCVFSDNIAVQGGGISNGGVDRVSAVNCAFVANTATEPSA